MSDASTTLLSLPTIDKPTAVGIREDRVAIYFTMTVHDGRITRGDVVLDPKILAYLNLVLDTRDVDVNPR